VSGGKWGGRGRLPHKGFDGREEAAACSRNDELLRCSPVLGVDGAQVILRLRRGAKQNQGPPVVLLLQVAGLGQLGFGSATAARHEEGNSYVCRSKKRVTEEVFIGERFMREARGLLYRLRHVKILQSKIFAWIQDRG
jgi:hypothetical protein